MGHEYILLMPLNLLRYKQRIEFCMEADDVCIRAPFSAIGLTELWISAGLCSYTCKNASEAFTKVQYSCSFRFTTEKMLFCRKRKNSISKFADVDISN